MHWSKAWIYGWLAILIGLAFYEFWSLYGPEKSTPPLTHVVVRYVPWYVTMPFVTWLWIHFFVRYLNPEYSKQLLEKFK